MTKEKVGLSIGKIITKPLIFFPTVIFLIGVLVTVVWNFVTLNKFDSGFTFMIGLVCGFFGMIIGVLMTIMNNLSNTELKDRETK